MAKNGSRALDSDLHTREPDYLWQTYLDEPFRKQAPTFTRSSYNAPNNPVIEIGNLAIGEMSKRPKTAVVAADLHKRSVAKHPHNDVAAARKYDNVSHVTAMDIEGIDVAVLYGTRGRQVLM